LTVPLTHQRLDRLRHIADPGGIVEVGGTAVREGECGLLLAMPIFARWLRD
jgi:hypothetical protein